MESFLWLYFILDYVWFKAPSDGLGAFLGMIDPTLWSDGKPIDMAIYGDWIVFTGENTLDESNILGYIKCFSEMMSQQTGQDFADNGFLSVLDRIDMSVMDKAREKVKNMYSKHDYSVCD